MKLLLCIALVFVGGLLLLAAGTGTITLSSFAKGHLTALKADTVTIDWEKMNHDDREEYMRHVVMPKMRKVFADFDANKYGKINCKTCHGDGASDQSFKMPNPKLPKLPKTSEGFAELNKKHPEMMKFMMETVKPTMASLLNMPPFDPKTHKGFGCSNCHTTE